MLHKYTTTLSNFWSDDSCPFGFQVTVGADDLTANYRVEQHVVVVEERERDGKLLRLLSTCHSTRYERPTPLERGSRMLDEASERKLAHQGRYVRFVSFILALLGGVS